MKYTHGAVLKIEDKSGGFETAFSFQIGTYQDFVQEIFLLLQLKTKRILLSYSLNSFSILSYMRPYLIFEKDSPFYIYDRHQCWSKNNYFNIFKLQFIQVHNPICVNEIVTYRISSKYAKKYIENIEFP